MLFSDDNPVIADSEEKSSRRNPCIYGPIECEWHSDSFPASFAIQGPIIASWHLYAIHQSRFVQQLSDSFPKIRTSTLPIHVLTLFQESPVDLIAVTDESQRVRDQNLLVCYAVCQVLNQHCQTIDSHAWCDLSDPASGVAYLDRNSCLPHADVDTICRVTRYSSIQAGCCRCLVHPQWGTRVYPSVFVLSANANDVISFLESIN